MILKPPKCCEHLIQLTAGEGLVEDTIWHRWTSSAEWAAWFARLGKRKHQEEPRTIEAELDSLTLGKFEQTPAGFVGRMRLSILSVVNALKPLSQCEVNAIKQQYGQPEYQVSAMLLWMRSCSERGIHSVACAAANTNMSEWIEQDVIGAEGISRRSGYVEGGEAGSYILLARMKTLLGRDLRPHEKEEEILERTTVSQAHYLTTERGIDGEKWNTAVLQELIRLIEYALGSQFGEGQEASKWEQTSGLWLPTGTTSESRKKYMEQNPNIKRGIERGAPVSKAMWWANKKFSLEKMLNTEPKIVARAATKNEPGLKRRALRAADDVSYLVASFASAKHEKKFSIEGGVMRQKPSDVKYTTEIIHKNKDSVILCIDYSNFNKTHQISTRSALNLIMAQVNKKYGRIDEARAAEWMARAHLNHYIDGKMVKQGLSSGERDTARDNTILHMTYSTVALKAINEQMIATPGLVKRFCGDDETIIGFTWSAALAYCIELMSQRHELQPRKFMISKWRGEFLQYNMSNKWRMPRQPLCPNLINLVSGSWYQTSRYNKTDIANQVSQACASAWRRGLGFDVAHKLAISCCNWLCTGIDWKSRIRDTEFFGGDKTKKFASSSVSREKIIRTIGKTPKAANRYKSYIMRKYPNMPEDLIKQLTNDVTVSIFAAAVAKTVEEEELQEQIDTEKVTWPKEPETKEIEDLANQIMLSESGERSDQMEMLAFRAGLPKNVIEEVIRRKIHKSVFANDIMAGVNSANRLSKKAQGCLRAAVPGALYSYLG